ncbi:beta-N-acetylhexosaminidase [Thalassotalea litorea]|uniref:beta-N-acetylhexosaminidase n=1 Tax=Thalassotalea litorea TaxID=2020715 RepID=A0A5R9IG69_9GAMM|nr:family 20 glycosylhydrolase [Thalassotalea litorea]TLU61630.1 beta-N-acetylhexosaminidase [Thalassotalea litorea]
MIKKTLLLSLSLSALLGCQPQSETHATNETEQFVHSNQLTQAKLDNFAQSLKVEFELVTNVADDQCDKAKHDGLCFQGRLNFSAKQDFPYKDWAIYFSLINPVQTQLPGEFTITHVNGDLHKIALSERFKGFKAGETKSLDFRADFWSLSETDLIPNYILTVDETSTMAAKGEWQARVIDSTRTTIDADTGLEISPFVKEYTREREQFKRTDTDQTQWATATVLFERNAKQRPSSNNLATSLIPTPKSMTVDETAMALDLSAGIQVNFNQVQPALVTTALARLETLGVKQSDTGVPVSLELNSASDSQSVKSAGNHSGAYILKIEQDQITVRGDDATGVFYGLQSLAGLIRIDDLKLQPLTISDEPHYDFRGMFVDVSRNFHSQQFLFDLIDQMAAYKLNKLHLHLADDEGWRLQIPGLEELTDIGSKRCFDLSEQTCLLPQLGAGVDSNSEVNGYFTVAQYQEILKYAGERHIQVIPSLDMPGHSRAAIVSMKRRYDKYMQAGEQAKAEQYMLHDPNDTTVYSSVQYYNDNTINACMDSSYDFIAKVMDEVKAMHREAGYPLTRYHIGADETAGAWVESPKCQAFIATNDTLEQPEGLVGYFIERVGHILAERDIEVAGWSDGMSHTKLENMPEVVQANAWGVLFWQGHQAAHKLVNQGWEVVVSNPDVMYFDFPYEADPKEHGYYWASRHINTEKIFSFMPDNLPAHAEYWLDREDQPYQADDSLSKDEQGNVLRGPMEKGKGFVGIQGQLWSENTRNDDLTEYKIFPRLLALAERAWHSPQWALPYKHNGQVYDRDSHQISEQQHQLRQQAWSDFANTMVNKEFAKLDLADIHYRIPTVGAKVENGILSINATYSGLSLQYRNGNASWVDYTAPVSVTKNEIWVRAKAVNSDRAGRAIKVQ